MTDAGSYSAIEALRDGRRVEIRAVRPATGTDSSRPLAAANAGSLHRRFFAVRRETCPERKSAFSQRT
jgi:hypothetical protein